MVASEAGSAAASFSNSFGLGGDLAAMASATWGAGSAAEAGPGRAAAAARGSAGGAAGRMGSASADCAAASAPATPRIDTHRRIRRPPEKAALSARPRTPRKGRRVAGGRVLTRRHERAAHRRGRGEWPALPGRAARLRVDGAGAGVVPDAPQLFTSRQSEAVAT